MATLVQVPEDVVVALERKIQAEDTPLPEKYRALFSLRNVAGSTATKALTTGGAVVAVPIVRCNCMWLQLTPPL